MPKDDNNEEWTEIDLAGLGLDDPIADAMSEADQAEQVEDEESEVVRKDITPNSVQKAFVPDGVVPQDPQSEVAKDWPRFKPHNETHPQTKPDRPYAYQEARSNIPLEDQQDIEPIVYDTPDGDVLVPQRSIFAKTPTENEAARRNQQQPPRGTVMTIEERKMRTIAAMESAMGSYLGINMAGHGMGELGKAKKKGGGLKGLMKKNKALRVATAVLTMPVNPMKATGTIVNETLKMFGVEGKSAKIASQLASGNPKVVRELLNQKKAKKKDEERKKAAQAAAAEMEQKKAETEVMKDITINYKETEGYVKDKSGNLKKVVRKIPESVNVWHKKYGNIVIPYDLYESSNKADLMSVAAEYKLAQEAQKKLAEEEAGIDQTIGMMQVEDVVRQDEVNAIQNPNYVPQTNAARDPQQIVQDNAQAAVNVMNNNNMAPSSQNVQYMAKQTSNAWIEQQNEELAAIRATLASLKQDKAAISGARQDYEQYIQDNGGIPEPPEPLYSEPSRENEIIEEEMREAAGEESYSEEEEE